MHNPKPQHLLSNAFRTCSLSILSVRNEVFGSDDCLGYRAVNGNLIPTGYATDVGGDDPLDILIREEETIDLL